MLEIAQCVSHFRSQRPLGKVVLMGHSTGCQDVMHYLLSHGEKPKIDGAVMQASVSDREAIVMLMDPVLLDRSVQIAQQYVALGREKDVLPDDLTNSIFPGPISAKRWLSLVSPGPEHTGEDDYFSSDLDDERLKGTFGKLGAAKTPMCILYGEKDPYVPDFVDRAALVERWCKLIAGGGGIVDEGSGVVPGSSHNLKELGASMEDVIGRGVRFLHRIEDGSIEKGSTMTNL